jgi:hypothetical protein
MAAQSWPIPVDGFFDLLGVQSASFGLPGDFSPSITAGGDVIRHRRGGRLWQGEVELGRSEHVDIAAQTALIEHLLEPGASFMIHDRRLAAPQDPAFPEEIDWSARTVTIASLQSGARELSLSGLPGGFTLRRGQMIGFSYLTAPVRHAVHRIVTATVTASPGGVTPAFEVTPFIRPGALVGTPVILDRPALKAVILKWEPGRGLSKVTQGGRFTWMQTLRGRADEL